MRSVRAASSGSCVTMTRLVPTARFSSSIRSNTCPAVRRSRLPVGSSASTHRGSVTSARASATRCRSPPESSPGRCLTRCPSPTRSSIRCAAARALGRGHAPDRERHRDVLQRGELRQQVVELVDEAERAVAHARRVPSPSARRSRALDADLARRRRVEPAQQVQQRALAGARGADDRDALAASRRRGRRRAAPAPRAARCR